ncbi:hypothetical protein PR202_ga10942 [Eleusine coracana subsp. coracana]|uniref:Uncharacterized protein n=1 Tax=Eleusine coracana subsp. coracana TaxID=191504 RepID=A0AAV5C822_ELECO|nr:hypothetical protein PR202_ga10942 [Eleusine coracana subsp. coracana]
MSLARPASGNYAARPDAAGETGRRGLDPARLGQQGGTGLDQGAERRCRLDQGAERRRGMEQEQVDSTEM